MNTLPAAAPVADLDTLSGSWLIVATTLPFWRHRTDPSVEYTIRADGRWDDVLRFRHRGRPKSLHGIDTKQIGGGFVWRGAGLLAVLQSSWVFAHVDRADTWCATAFSAASFGLTPAGMDVYARARPDDAWVEATIREMAQRFPAFPGAMWFAPGRSGR